jgi:hypothetical protein
LAQNLMNTRNSGKMKIPRSKLPDIFVG